MKPLILMIAIFAVFIGGVVWLFIWDFSAIKIKDPGYTIGKTIDLRLAGNKGGLVEIEYQVSGKKYTNSKPSKAGMTLDDRYRIMYDKSDPERSVVLDPIFLKGESTKFTSGEVILVITIGRNNLTYRYEVNDKFYKRSRTYNGKEYSPSRGEKYSVEFWVENPQRAIIHLDKKLEN